MPTGTLQVRVYTSNAQLPVANATVIVSSTDTPRRLLSVQVTNSSGETRPIEIETPPLGESTSPGTPLPFTSVNVTVDEPFYREEVLENVTIFPGIISNQNVELIPLEEISPDWSEGQTIDVPNQNL